MAEPALFLVSVDGDVADVDQLVLRECGLFPAGHVGMSATANTRDGSSTTFFNVIAADGHDAREQAERHLARFQLCVLAVERVPESKP